MTGPARTVAFTGKVAQRADLFRATLGGRAVLVFRLTDTQGKTVFLALGRRAALAFAWRSWCRALVFALTAR